MIRLPGSITTAQAARGIAEPAGIRIRFRLTSLVTPFSG